MMRRTLIWTAEPAQEGLTIEQFLRALGCSHHVLTHLRQTERGVLLNGIPAYTNRRMRAGDELTVQIQEEGSSSGILPVRMPLDIIYEDEDLMVINKPSGMPVHPSVNNYENTLANAVMYYFTAQDTSFVFRCINRLDRDTSGLLVIAKNMLSAAILSRMSAGRGIHREYLAVAEGILPESGTIDAPIARKENSALMRCVDPERGQRAVTHFRRLKICEAPALPSPGGPEAAQLLSLASVRLETGRTHQIRVHMSHIGHPLVGDFLYHPDSVRLIGRQALHSHRLEFAHPVTGRPLSFICEMPEDMRALCSRPARPGLSC